MMLMTKLKHAAASAIVLACLVGTASLIMPSLTGDAVVHADAEGSLADLLISKGCKPKLAKFIEKIRDTHFADFDTVTRIRVRKAGERCRVYLTDGETTIQLWGRLAPVFGGGYVIAYNMTTWEWIDTYLMRDYKK